MVTTAEGTGIRQVCWAALFGVLVVERFPMIHIAAPDRLPAGRELADVEDGGDLVAEFLGGSVGEGSGGGDGAGVGVGEQGVDGAGGGGDAAGQAGGDGAEPGEGAG